jgi:hypothetical protein
VKTGCAYSKRQLSNAHSLLLALALTLPVAWHLLLTRYLSRHSPDMPASVVLNPVQIALLRATATKQKLGEQPTIEQAYMSIARLGGHLPRNGLPGWKTLGLGYQTLLDYEKGWRLAQNEKLQPHSDLS